MLNLLRHINTPNFGGIVFRRTRPELIGAGSVWEYAQTLYRPHGARFNRTELLAAFPSGASIKFNHLQHDDDKLQHHGKAYAVIVFEELTHFTASQFWYLVSRNRSTCGVRPYMRGTCNADGSSWVRPFIDWWVGEDGLIIPERSGVIRWFHRGENDEIHWADTEQELREQFPHGSILSFTFIHARLTDNQALLDADPAYAEKLASLPRLERRRLAEGDWNAMPEAGDYFKKEWFEVVDAPPAKVKLRVRAWDRAGTKPKPGTDPDWTVGVLMSITHDNEIYIEDLVRFRDTPAGNERRIKNTAIQDGKSVRIALWEDPGSAGKDSSDYYVRRVLQGFTVKIKKATASKTTYAEPISTQAERGNVYVVRAVWNSVFFSETQAFPLGPHDDIVDAVSGAYIHLVDDKAMALKRLAQSKIRI